MGPFEVVVGAPAIGGSVPSGNGGDGSPSIFRRTVPGTIYSATGGGGSSGVICSSTPMVQIGGLPGSGNSGYLRRKGEPGGIAFAFELGGNSFAIAGKGGTILGGGGISRGSASNGVSQSGSVGDLHGCGAGGAFVTAGGAAANGQDSAPGRVVIIEYISS